MSKNQAIETAAQAIAEKHGRAAGQKDMDLAADIVAALEALGIFSPTK